MHNHLKKLLKMYESGQLKPDASKACRLEVRHDNWCRLLKGRGECNCNPDVSQIEVRVDDRSLRR